MFFFFVYVCHETYFSKSLTPTGGNIGAYNQEDKCNSDINYIKLYFNILKMADGL